MRRETYVPDAVIIFLLLMALAGIASAWALFRSIQ
jgi:hypothetical protein